MWSLIDAIQSSKIPVHTYNEGNCHSAAFLVFLAGQKRICNPHAFFIAHEGSAMLGGSFKETKAAMAYYEKEQKEMQKFIADHTLMGIDFITQKFDTNSDWYIDQKEAIELGIVTEYFEHYKITGGRGNPVLLNTEEEKEKK